MPANEKRALGYLAALPARLSSIEFVYISPALLQLALITIHICHILNINIPTLYLHPRRPEESQLASLRQQLRVLKSVEYNVDDEDGNLDGSQSGLDLRSEDASGTDASGTVHSTRGT